MEKSKVLILDEEGFKIDESGNPEVHVEQLKQFLVQDKYSKINSMPGFNKAFEQNSYSIIDCVQDLCDESLKLNNIYIVLM